MPDKSLTEAAWKTFAKSSGGSYKDAALLKALAAFEKAEKSGAAAELEALDDLAKQADAVRKAGKADKKLADYLDGLDKALDKQRKTSEQALKNEKNAGSDDEEEESPALLTSKLIPLLRDVRKGDTVLQALIATAGKDTAVMLSRKAIAPARGKLLKEYLQASGAVKFIHGQCIFEANAHTFVVQSAAAGLAKKLKAALLAQTDLRVKVRVRGEDPDDLDDDGDDADDGQDGGNDAAPGVKAEANAGSNAPPAPPPPEQAAFESRLAKLEPLVQQALKDQAGDVSRIRALAAFAREKGQARAWAAGLQSLDALQKVLAAATPTATQPPSTGDVNVDQAAAFNARLAALMPKVKDALAAAGPGAADLKLKVSEAGALARQRRFEPAQALLDELEELLAGKGTAGRSEGDSGDEDATAGDTGDTGTQPGRPGLVQQRVFMLERWKKIPAELKARLGELQKSIVVGDADEDPDELVGDISDYLSSLLRELQDDMDDAINAGSTDAFKGLAQRVEGDPMMQLLAEHPSMDGGAFRTSVLQALGEIEKNLAG